MNAEIIAIGSELLTPFRQDTNSLFLTERLNELGLSIGDKCTVSLRLPRIYARREAEKQTGIPERAAARPPFRKRFRSRVSATPY